MKLRTKRFLFGLLAAAFSSAALAQTTLLPGITGTDSVDQNMIDYVGIQRWGVNSTMAALAGGAQAGTALTKGVNRFTTVATGGDSAQLPLLTGAVVIVVVNATVTSMNVFGQTGQTINAGAANAAFAVAGGKTVIFIQANDGNWYAVLSA